MPSRRWPTRNELDSVGDVLLHTALFEWFSLFCLFVCFSYTDLLLVYYGSQFCVFIRLCVMYAHVCLCVYM